MRGFSNFCPATLPKEASIFTAEAHVLKMAVYYIQRTGSTENVIFTDSRSAIEALHSKSHQLHKFQLNNIRLELCWIPSHTGIKLNDKSLIITDFQFLDLAIFTLLYSSPRFLGIFNSASFLKFCMRLHNNLP